MCEGHKWNDRFSFKIPEDNNFVQAITAAEELSRKSLDEHRFEYLCSGTGYSEAESVLHSLHVGIHNNNIQSSNNDFNTIATNSQWPSSPFETVRRNESFSPFGSVTIPSKPLNHNSCYTPIISNIHMYCIPRQVDLNQAVNGFRVGHSKYGEIEFLSPVNVSLLGSQSLDSIITFSNGCISLYHNLIVPPKGEQFNVPAKITLRNNISQRQLIGLKSLYKSMPNISFDSHDFHQSRTTFTLHYVT